jgi:hypothetical protein
MSKEAQMIQQFVDAFMSKKELLESQFREKHPSDYSDIVERVIRLVTAEDEYSEYSPDPARIHAIDDGDYQGTLLFVIGAKGYQPDDYWYVKVGYGSCSGCDTFQAISDYVGDTLTEEQLGDYMSLALHIVQDLKKMEG